DHPQMCASTYKETRFFLNENYPLKRRVPFSKNISDYNSLFDCNETTSIKLEATPDYLFSADTEKFISETLNDCMIILLLRNPIDRLISWYKFSQQMNLLDQKTSFNEYVELMFENKDKSKQHLLALEQGNYFKYINNYLEYFGKDSVHILLYDSFIKSPFDSAVQICNKLKINADFYYDYSFKTHNKTINIKHNKLHGVFNETRRSIRKLVNKAPAKLRSQIKKSGKKLVSAYLELNTTANSDLSMDDAIKNRLKNYYSDSNAQCETLIGKKTDWN
ncbi:MAG: sulfotransferase family 2 domain-containing protein, partial [Bacteroidia bacterium]|nr:sulfotransferase family 2 domain-containing protein [Bacteroidia bacterium]